MKRKILTGLLSLAISLGLWLYVVTVVSPGSDNTYYDVPVVLQGEGVLEERGLMITTEELPTVDLRVKGNRTDLKKLNSSNITISVDVSKITEPGEHTLSISANNVSYPGDVADNALTVESRSPDQIKLQVKRRTSKPVPVNVVYTGTLPEGFIADKENSELDYKEIQVTGPTDVVDRITNARVDLDLEGRNETVRESLAYTLCDANGEPVDAALITTNVEVVNLTLRIMRVKEVTLKLNVIDGGGATAQTCQIELDHESILVSGSERLLKDLEEIELGTIDLGELLADTTLTFPITLPDGVSNETGITEITAQIRFPNLRTKTLNITNIQAINVPEGKTASIITKALEVYFRGPKALIDGLKESNVTITVDFTNAQTGTATMRADVVLEAEYAQVGAVGSYSVSATLR